MDHTYRSGALTELEMGTAVILLAFARAGISLPAPGEPISRAERIRVSEEIAAMIEAADSAPFASPPGRPPVRPWTGQTDGDASPDRRVVYQIGFLSGSIPDIAARN